MKKINNYITTNELMQMYKVTRRTIVNWRNEGMPSYKIGRLVRFKIDEVEKWINKNK